MVFRICFLIWVFEWAIASLLCFYYCICRIFLHLSNFLPNTGCINLVSRWVFFFSETGTALQCISLRWGIYVRLRDVDICEKDFVSLKVNPRMHSEINSLQRTYSSNLKILFFFSCLSATFSPNRTNRKCCIYMKVTSLFAKCHNLAF